MKKLLPTLTSITIFSIAMAFLETTVVIYLRELLYPGGFNFPLAPMPGKLVLTEILREFATITMLIGAGALAGKTFSQKFAWFIYSFAIWDVFYYIFLKVLINWPESFMTWDILFLIPTTWTGPVISPIIVSLTMIALALIILNFAANGINSRIIRREWLLLISGSGFLIIAFTWDYSRFILEHFSIKELWSLRDTETLYNTAMAYIPISFNWSIFTSGEIVLFVTIFIYFRRIKGSLVV
jgi:hypothetical protein